MTLIWNARDKQPNFCWVTSGTEDKTKWEGSGEEKDHNRIIFTYSYTGEGPSFGTPSWRRWLQGLKLCQMFDRSNGEDEIRTRRTTAQEYWTAFQSRMDQVARVLLEAAAGAEVWPTEDGTAALLRRGRPGVAVVDAWCKLSEGKDRFRRAGTPPDTSRVLAARPRPERRLHSSLWMVWVPVASRTLERLSEHRLEIYQTSDQVGNLIRDL